MMATFAKEIKLENKETVNIGCLTFCCPIYICILDCLCSG